ncbi:hypothetical protein HPB48_026648 [Haemaphysalis longicornis]|uniref:PA domain-containing protein n=1 Tax=Haemaphysalis longicornis TaxID=44386 RepID=A0A9J6HA09_HAELO|nr:hypothetical protein HPB48_026648 [Haemaphysalis longicornis]
MLCLNNFGQRCQKGLGCSQFSELDALAACFESYGLPCGVMTVAKNSVATFGGLGYSDHGGRKTPRPRCFDVHARTADVVHVGAGTYDDVDELEARNVSLKGRICLARYSGGHRGGKVTVCQERGGVGAVLYLDLPKKPDKGYYPNSDIVDGSALQRGSLFIPADPETPGYPSVDGVFRLTNSSALPKIPALTVTNNFAMRLLSQIEGPEVTISKRPVKLGSFKDGK